MVLDHYCDAMIVLQYVASVHSQCHFQFGIVQCTQYYCDVRKLMNHFSILKKSWLKRMSLWALSLITLVHHIHGDHSMDPVVLLDGCTILGKWDVEGFNVAQFRSVPYVQPPVNDLRWAPPILVTDYSDTPNICQNEGNLINATYHHSMCWQPWYPDGEWPPDSENCLHLV